LRITYDTFANNICEPQSSQKGLGLCFSGSTENAGPENDGPSKSRGWKCMTWNWITKL